MRVSDTAQLPHAPPAGADDAQLRQAARDLEGVFVAELFKAMRQTVPEGGLAGGGVGEEMFTGMLDQHLAPQTGASWERGIADALYRQLRGMQTPADAPEGEG